MMKLLVLLFLPLSGLWASSPKIIKVYSTYMGGFAGLRDDGTITVWGDSTYGGHLPQSVSDQLAGRWVEKIFSGNCAFAALIEGGMLVTWGGSKCGGDSSRVATELASGVVSVHGTTSNGFSTNLGAFAALKSDGSVVTWGNSAYGGDSSGVASRLTSGVNKVVANLYNFTALKNDGSVVTWGEDGFDNFLASTLRYSFNRDPSLFLQSGVVDVFSSGQSFVALKDDGQLVGWGKGGEADTLRISKSTQNAAAKVVHIYSSRRAYAALKDDGTALVWGEPYFGGSAVRVQNQLTGVTGMVTNQGGFAALKEDGTVVTWEGRFQDIPSDGEAWEHDRNPDGGRRKLKQINLNTQGVKVIKLFAGQWVFVALKEDGTVAVWGYRESGADTAVATAAIGTGRVVDVIFSREAVAVLKDDDSVVTWGDSSYGGDSSSVSSQLASDVIEVVGSRKSFSALKLDGTVVTW